MNLEGQPPSQGQARGPEVWLSGAQPAQVASGNGNPKGGARVEAQPKGCE